MGILSNSVSLQQYKVVGKLPPKDLDDWFQERLEKEAFEPIDDGTRQVSIGWVQTEDTTDASFANPSFFRRDHYAFFTMRKDERKVPAALLRNRLKAEFDRYIEDHPDHSWVPKRQKEEIRDRVQYELLSKTLATPATFDVLWNLETGVLSVASLASKIHERLEDLFARTFGGMSLVAIHPFARAIDVLPTDMLPAINQANKATTDDVISLIADNQWIGWDFLLWLLHQSIEGSGTFKVTTPGPAVEGESFVAYLNNRLVLTEQREDGTQKIAATGPQKDFAELKKPLADGKRIVEATIYMEMGEDTWNLTLKSDLFTFGSFRTPKVKLEKDDITDQAIEREAVFFERMALLEKGFQMFDSLYARFLTQRLGKGWGKKSAQIRDWLTT